MNGPCACVTVRDFGARACATRGSVTIAKTAFVSTYPPQRCGIATFTADLAAAVGNGEVVAIEPPEKSGFYPPLVRHRIARDVTADYRSAARWIDSDSFDAVSIQHDFGIWGGREGSNVLDFVRALRTPAVSTLHTVLRRPTAAQRRILTELVQSSAASVVMSNSAAELLTETYGTDPARVRVIPHGVPHLPLVASATVKPQLGLGGRTVILSFGRLGPGKGYESAIAAMPAVLDADPSALYVIVGASQPEVARHEGESYRASLQKLAASLRVNNHVRFVERYVDARELNLWLSAADIFVTPYPDMDQIISGTLSYAMGAGKAIVSTPFAYAKERLADGRGRLVAADSAEALAEGLIELALNAALRDELGRRAYADSRETLWPEVGAAYGQLFANVARLNAQPEYAGMASGPVAVAGA